MPIWGLPSVAQAIASAGFNGPQHCDEPWPYRFSPGQQVLVHIRGEGQHALWLPARVVHPTRVKQYPTTTLQYYLLAYLTPSPSQGEFSPQDGTVKPDTPYVRALIAEELAWPVEERSFEYQHGASNVAVPLQRLHRAPGGRTPGSH